MRLSKPIAYAIQFARFSVEMGIPAADLGQMVAAAVASVRAYERDDSKKEHEHGEAVEKIAAMFGCEVDWPGLWPCVQKKGNPRSNQLLPAYA